MSKKKINQENILSGQPAFFEDNDLVRVSIEGEEDYTASWAEIKEKFDFQRKPTPTHITKDFYETKYSDMRLETPDGKYYTPSIEEFHVGFEYIEISRDNKFLPCKIEPYDLSSCDIDMGVNNTFDYITEDLKTGGILVKYLDREDIESFGFTFKTFGAHDGIMIFNSKYKDRTGLLINLLTNVRLGWVSIYFGDEGTGSQNLFAGTIKNKSELKRLLRQLNIIE